MSDATRSWSRTKRAIPSNRSGRLWTTSWVIPPFLGHVPFREQLGEDYVDAVYALYGDRIPNSSDLCCYWFEKARGANRCGPLPPCRAPSDSGNTFPVQPSRPGADQAEAEISSTSFPTKSGEATTLTPQAYTSRLSASTMAANHSVCWMANARPTSTPI